MTLTGALDLRLGGAPAGPAGTGKTETTKDLAKALAVQCVVFNCSDGLDYKIMGRFFSGLAQAGAWVCFDEFNRIDIEVLSVIAQQVLCIQQAIIADVDRFEFEGKMIRLNTGFGVFITMNPGYAGRTELPDNLKALFRPVAMMLLDYRLIVEIVLFSEGFANALPLSHKMTQLYSLSNEQLSKQDHYDFGMRAVKSVLVAVGQLKRKEPEMHEDLLLIRSIIADLFPGVTVPFADYGLLQKTIEKQLELLHLQQVPLFITKAIQVHETQLVRHGMMLVGEAGSGKSTNCYALARALTQLFEDGVVDHDGFYKVVQRLILNPKSISAGQLYGEFNLLTNEWTDGLVPKLVRQCVQDAAESDACNWVIFDGPVDAVWIENMDTVLDDNKTLCLSNSERIKLPHTLHMMFEVQDLRVASPATVSRCGMVYMEQVHVGMCSLARTWKVTTLETILSSPELCNMVLRLIETHVPIAIAFVRDHCRERITSNNANLMTACLNLLASCLANGAAQAGSNVADLAVLLRVHFVFAVTWSISANIDDASRPKFNDFCIGQFRALIDGDSDGGNSSSTSVKTVDNVYDVVIDESTGQWVSWVEKMPRFTFQPGASYFSMVVPTQDTTRFRYLLEKLLLADHHVLYSGETGVGKSVIIQSFLDDIAKTDSCISATMSYSVQTKPRNLYEQFELRLEEKRKNLLGPPAGKRMLFFVDDLNMPALDIYGAQPLNELLRQIIDQGGFCDTSKMFFKNIKDVVFTAACAPPGGGRSEVSPRLLRHFHMVWIPNLSSEVMKRIFLSILGGFLTFELPLLIQMVTPIVNASVQLYQRVELEMLPTLSKSHYTFNLRDLSKVFQGMLMIKKDSVTNEEGLLKVWLHEEARVFRDRLVDADDRRWFNSACSELLQEHVNISWTPESFENLLYGDYLTRENRSYRPVDDLTRLHTLLMEYIWCSSTTPCTTSRGSVVCCGNALLVGVGGSGRQSLTRLAAFMAEYKCFSIEITRGYGANEFHEDLKKVLMTAGAENKPVVFLFLDAQIVHESFLEDINNVLNTGEVLNLYANLDEPMPAYYASIKALSQLKKDDITVLKTFTNPPRLVGVTTNAVCLLFGAKQEWNGAKKLLNDMKFLDKLKEYDKDNIPPKTIRALAKFMADKEFTSETLSSISTAATSLCMWVRAMYTYDTVAKNIAPKKENLKQAEERLEREQQQLQIKQSGLNAVLKKVADLKRTLEDAQQKKIDLEKQTQTTQAQLVRAERLIDSLGEEQGRWKECAEGLTIDMVNLVGDMILSVGCIAYLGPFTAEFRHDLQQKWVAFCKQSGLPVDSHFSFQRVLADPVVVREWNIMGLPADTFSIENGLFTTLGRRWPLMIDP
ncbi:Dynein heavy chain, partial [Globisporangium splendens]